MIYDLFYYKPIFKSPSCKIPKMVFKSFKFAFQPSMYKMWCEKYLKVLIYTYNIRRVNL